MGARESAKRTRMIASDVYWLPVKGCNVYVVGSVARWVLIDTGWPNSAGAILRMTESLFGPSARPTAILLTHAHPDHFGSAAELSQVWRSPIYAHRDDLPYLQGGVLPDGLLDPIGRALKRVERALPERTVERIRSSPLEDMVDPLPERDLGFVGLPDWEIIHTPGHSPGHVVFFRPGDRALVAGDATLTAPFWGLLTAVQRPSRPPWMASWNWDLTKASVAAISRLEPRLLATGHGVPMTGDRVSNELAKFAARFSTRPGRRRAVVSP